MVKRAFFCSLLVTFMVFGYSVSTFAADAGPETLTLTSSDSTKKPPSVFPHKNHQALMDCGACHHGMADGKQTPYTDGMEIKKCEECHNSNVLAGKTKGKDKLDTFKGAAHGNCLDCHKEEAKKDPAKKDLKSCKTCHKK